ncbi:hypothetical protein J422_05444 [Methanocaldococcus villosus KIN24-T80]|uniref:HTH arsR-type domain-containing protein n=1 Tax=Methanocaldococcus villosus KIN24-T80 TaxID=1069083 RepID=N6V0N8_9EURY|nr:hypothetical protein [Methanocaldococcus villosus]ENN95878.1 hypothetical protein J422_05444 [Methanocaldococcus villosus KIN24-T80]
MEYLPKEIVSTIYRKAILHYMLITGSTFPQKLSEDLNISKGLACSFLRLCSALGFMERKRLGHRVYYNLTKVGIAKLKRMAAEIFDLSFSNVFEILSKKKFTLKHYPLSKVGFSIKWEKDFLGGYTFYFYDSNGELIGKVFRNTFGEWWCVPCQSKNCKHIEYLKKLYEKIKDD